MLAAAAVAGSAATATAANLLDVYYDARSDELVATLAFRGTHAAHNFYLQWSECHKSSEEGVPHEIAALVIDAHGTDIAKEDYMVIERFDLAQLDCRPARVTLRVNPRVSRTVFVPARPGR